MTLPVLFLIKANILIVVFFALYYVVLRKQTFFTLNRIYLVAGAVLSLTIPWLTFGFLEPVPLQTMNYVASSKTFSDEIYSNGKEIINSFEQTSITLNSAIAFTYYGGVLFFLLRFGIFTIYILRQKNTSGYTIVSGQKCYDTKRSSAFSFFNIIFIPQGQLHPLIIHHESAHVKQYHWIDLLILEVLSAVLWINPIVLLYKRALKQQHEYLADEYVLRQGNVIESYLQLILQHISGNTLYGPVNEFHTKSLKNRIVMMTKTRTPFKKSFLYLLLLPFVSLLIVAFSSTDQNAGKAIKNDMIIVLDPAHGGADAGAMGVSGTSEKLITLEVARLVKTLAAEKGLTVVLTRDKDHEVALAERILRAEKENATVFVSIHAASTDKANIECYFSEQGTRAEESKRLAASLLNTLNKISGGNTSQLKSSSAYVLKNNRIPAAIVELGFLGNAAAEKYIQSKENQQRIAAEILHAIVSF